MAGARAGIQRAREVVVTAIQLAAEERRAVNRELASGTVGKSRGTLPEGLLPVVALRTWGAPGTSVPL